MSINRISAIFIKEVQDLRKNKNIIYMYFIPILLTLIWDKIVVEMPDIAALGFGLMFLVVMVGIYVPSMLISEEKEKHTMEVLLLSPASPSEVFIGKGLMTFLSILVTSVVIVMIVNTSFSILGIIFLGTVLISLFSITLGMIVGVLAPNQMSTGIIGLPVYLILLLIPNFAMMGNELMLRLAKVLPTYYYLDMLDIAYNDGGLGNMTGNIFIIIGSTILAVIVLLGVFRKKGLE